MNGPHLHLLVAAACCAFVLAGCGDDDAISEEPPGSYTPTATVATVTASEANVTVTFSNEATTDAAEVSLLVDGATVDVDLDGAGATVPLRLEEGAHAVALTDGTHSEQLDVDVADAAVYVGAIHWGERDSPDQVRLELWRSDEPIGAL